MLEQKIFLKELRYLQ